MGDRAFGMKLKELREAAGMSQVQLADAIGVGLRTIGRLENGTVDAAWPTVLALCEALNVECTAFKVDAAKTKTAKPKMGRPKKK